VKKLALIMAVVALYAPLQSTRSAILANCFSDCKDQYESEVESCKSTYNDPADPYAQGKCVTKARDEFYGCLDKCEK